MLARKKARLDFDQQLQHERQKLSNTTDDILDDYDEIWLRMYELFKNMPMENHVKHPWDLITSVQAAYKILCRREVRIVQMYHSSENNYFNPFTLACKEFEVALNTLEKKLYECTVADLFDESKTKQDMYNLHMRRRAQISKQKERREYFCQLEHAYKVYWQKCVADMQQDAEEAVCKTRECVSFMDPVSTFVRENFPAIFEQVDRQTFKQDVPTYIVECWTHFPFGAF